MSESDGGAILLDLSLERLDELLLQVGDALGGQRHEAGTGERRVTEKSMTCSAVGSSTFGRST